MPNSEPAPVRRKYVVTSDRCVWGKPGEEVVLAFTEGQELSLLQSGAVKRAKTRPSAAVESKE